MNFSDFLLVEFTWVNQAIYLSVAPSDRSAFLPAVPVLSNTNVSTLFLIKVSQLQIPFHTSLSLCCSSFSSTIWFKVHISTPAPSLPSTTTRWRETVVPTSRIAVQFGILYGAVLSQYFRALGSQCTLMFHVRRSGTQLYRLQDIASLCSFALCLCPSTCSRGQLGSS